MQRYRFLLTPRWIVLTVLVGVAVVAMVLAGLWQLRRLDERRARNDIVRERSAEPAVPVDQVLRAGQSLDDARSTAEWRRVSATGTYDEAGQVLVRNRSLDGAPGYHVVTPLRLDDGTALLVNRGWIPVNPAAGQRPEAPAPPDGSVTVEGRVRASQQRGALGPRDPADGVLTEVVRVDVGRLAQQLAYPVLPAYVELEAQEPAPSTPLPRLIPLPELDEGPHLAYAVQWAIFTVLAVVGWVLVVRRHVQQEDRRRRRAGPDPADASQPTAPV